jgi:hypothetical protein
MWATETLVTNRKDVRQCEYLGADRIKLKSILRKYIVCELSSSGSGQGSITGPCEHDNGPSLFIKKKGKILILIPAYRPPE